MTQEETKAAAAVMLASETKNIQQRFRYGKSEADWLDVNEPEWDWDSYDYRIAPEPVEVEVWVHPDGRIRNRKYWPDSETANYEGFTLRRATIHPESE